MAHGSRTRANLLLLLCSAIWGFAFVAQVVGAHVGAFTFLAVRSVLGFASLLPVIVWLDRRRPVPAGPTGTWRAALVPGLLCGVALFGGSALQQLGIERSTAGNSAFLTGLYVVLVPLVGVVFLGHRLTATIWAGALLAVAGLYLLTVGGGPGQVYPGDPLVLAGTGFWTLHILVVGHFSARVDPLRLAALQFLACALYATVVALLVEPRPFADLQSGWVPLLYAGIMSSGVGFTLQVVAQSDALASHAALIMSLETVFGALGGALLLGERMTPLGYAGAALMLGGILVSQLPPPGRRERPFVPVPEPPSTALDEPLAPPASRG